MNTTDMDPLAAWARWPAGLETALRRTPAIDGRAAAISRLLRQTVPATALAGCRLDHDDGPVLAIEGADTPQHEARAEQLRKRLAGLDAKAETFTRFPIGDNGSGFAGIAAVIVHDSRRRGCLALAISSPIAGLEAALQMAAHTLAVQLEMEECDRRLQEVMAQQREWTEFLAAGDILFDLIHEMNNSLNSMMLQASVVELKVDPAVREEVSQIRRFGQAAANRLATIRQFRDQYRSMQSHIQSLGSQSPPA